MSVTVTSAGGSFTPLLRLTANETLTSANVIHQLLGGSIAVTFGEPAKPTTTYDFVFDNETDAYAAFNLLNTGTVFDLVDTDKATTSETFVVAGSVSREYQTDTRDFWIVTVDVQTLDV